MPYDSVFATIQPCIKISWRIRPNVAFKDLLEICRKHFGEPRIKGNHHIFKTPWQGDPRINIQKEGKMAKPYQVRIVQKALEKQEEQKDEI